MLVGRFQSELRALLYTVGFQRVFPAVVCRAEREQWLAKAFIDRASFLGNVLRES